MNSIHACLAAQYVTDETEKTGSAVYIGTHMIDLSWFLSSNGLSLDSEGSFIIERVASMAEHFLEDFFQLGLKKLVD